MNSIIRDIELSKITGNLNNDSEKIVKYFNDLFNNTIVEYNSDSELLLRKSDKTIMMESFSKNVIWVKSDIWQYLKKGFNLTNNEISKIIEFMLEQHLNKSVLRPMEFNHLNYL